MITKKAYFYSRFSSIGQAKGTSLERQAEMQQAMATRHSWEVDKHLHFADRGRSAFHGFRADLQRLLDCISDGRIAAAKSVVVFEKIDRLSRADLDESQELIKRILRAGVDVATCQPERIYTKADLKDLGTGIEIMVTLYQAHQFSKNLSDRITDVWERRRQRGYHGGCCPAWIQYRDGKPLLVPDKAKVIQQIFTWCISGMGCSTIAKKLTLLGVPNIASGTRTTAKPIWRLQYILKILRSKACCGTLQRCKLSHTEQGRQQRIPIGAELADYYPAVVSEDVWLQAQRTLDSRRKPKGKRATRVCNLFEGLIFDAPHQRPLKLMNGSTTDHKRGITRRLSNYPAEPSGSIPYCDFETHFLTTLRMEIDSRNLTAPSLQISKLPALEAKLDSTERKIAEFQKQMLDDEFAAGLELLQKLDQQRRELTTEIASEKQSKAGDKYNAHREVLSILDLLSKTPQAELAELKDRLKTLIGQTVQRIEMRFSTLGNRWQKQMECSAQLVNGGKIWFQIRTTKGKLVNRLVGGKIGAIYTRTA